MKSFFIALVFSVPLASAAVWGRNNVPQRASNIAGSTVSAVFPPPGATNAPPADDAFFPTNVGFAGPTPTGDEAGEIVTATAVPLVTGVGPLLNPSTLNGPQTAKTFEVTQLWGNLAPMFSVSSFGLPNANQLIPSGCQLVQAHLLHRHGARYPTSGAPPSAFAAKINAAATSKNGFVASGDLSFLNTWTYKLGAELLTPFGRQQMYDLGVAWRVKYGFLLKGTTELPVFRTTSEDRMLHSALNFGAGFFGVPDFETAYRQLIIIESPGFNNTLAPFETCVNANNAIGNFGSVQANKWRDIYLQDAVKRLQSQIKGVNITTVDAFGMQQTCAYETVALGFSDFCDLFTEQEWLDFEYWNDLSFWYGIGPGNPTSAAQGIGYVQELISRLTQKPIAVNNSTTNATLDDSSITFPLSQPIFVDATHDVVISNIVVALNFTSLAGNGPLPTDHIPKGQTWFTNQIAPFGSNLVAQVLSCPAQGAKTTSATHIRWLLNDGVVPLTGIKGCKADPNGLCDIKSFISSMQERIREIDFAFDCLGNFSIPTPDNIVDGRPPANIRPKTG